MAALYSKFLAGVYPLGSGSPFIGTAVPTGYIWVIRDVVAVNLGTPGGVCLGFSLFDGSNLCFFSAPTSGCVCGRMYHAEMRQVLNTGDQIHAQNSASNWSVRISGYALTTP